MFERRHAILAADSKPVSSLAAGAEAASGMMSLYLRRTCISADIRFFTLFDVVQDRPG
jgi:hypothetical protein